MLLLLLLISRGELGTTGGAMCKLGLHEYKLLLMVWVLHLAPIRFTQVFQYLPPPVYLNSLLCLSYHLLQSPAVIHA